MSSDPGRGWREEVPGDGVIVEGELRVPIIAFGFEPSCALNLVPDGLSRCRAEGKRPTTTWEASRQRIRPVCEQVRDGARLGSRRDDSVTTEVGEHRQCLSIGQLWGGRWRRVVGDG